MLHQVAKAHSDILVQHSGTKRATKQLCIIFEALEAVALPADRLPMRNSHLSYNYTIVKFKMRLSLSRALDVSSKGR